MERIYAMMLTSQEQKTNIDLFFELQNKRKALCIELHNRKVSLKKIQCLIGMSNYVYDFAKAKFEDKNLAILSITELLQLANKTRKEYDAVFLKLRRTRNRRDRICPDCGKPVINNHPYHSTGSATYHLNPCWERKFID